MRLLKLFCVWIFLACCVCPPARAQAVQFLPEVDTYVKLNPDIRVYVQAKNDRDGGEPNQLAIGPSIQFYLKPLLRLKKITRFDLDESKSRPLVVETGYRAVTSPGADFENRAIEAVTFHLPVTAGLLITDRNRADLDWKGGKFTWRYRNKLTLERTFTVHSYHFIPYLATEPFYESQYSKWSTTSFYAGVLLPVNKRFQFDTYYEHENNTGKSPNDPVNSLGLALYVYFSLEKK